jgi:hypothetical protein
MIAVYVGTKNSVSGNPKRGWAVYGHDGQLEDFVDEGYSGRQALKVAGYSDLPETGRIDITPGQYRDFMRTSKGKAGRR